MITLKNLIENSISEETGITMGSGATTQMTQKGYGPVGTPIRTTEAQKKLSVDEKKKLMELVSQFNEYRKAFKAADDLKQVAEKIAYISELTEKYGMNETSEWFEGVTLERDMKDLKKLAESIHKSLNKCYQPIKEAEALYEEAGLKLERYFHL
jgi:DNA repair ATPase RecN